MPAEALWRSAIGKMVLTGGAVAAEMLLSRTLLAEKTQGCIEKLLLAEKPQGCIGKLLLAGAA